MTRWEKFLLILFIGTGLFVIRFSGSDDDTVKILVYCVETINLVFAFFFITILPKRGN